MATTLFVYAGATDLVDGWIARRWSLQTVVGTVIDPMADKALMTVLTVSLAMKGAVPLPLAVLILGRDILLSLAAIYYRYISLPPPKTLARYWDFSLPSAEVHPTGISKVNTALQLGLIGWTMGTMAVGGDLGWWGPEGALKAMCTTTVSLSDVTTVSTTLTVAETTTFATLYATTGNILKRENAATITSTIDAVSQPYYAYNSVSDIVSNAGRNASIAAQVYSACSCLNLSPQTVSSQATVQTTRTITARVEATEAAATVTSGTFTSIVTATVVPLPFFPTANLTADISSFYPSTGTGPINSAGTSLLYPTLTSIPYPGTNTTYTYDPPTLTLASTTLTAEDPFATSVGKGGCPSVNNTIYTLPTGQQYQIQCYRTYGGAVSIGIDAPQLVDCMKQCSMANSGFSAIRCFGVSWMSYPTTGLHCNLKSQNALSIFTANFFAASAVLLTGVPPPPVGVFDSGKAGDSSVGGQLPDDDPGTWRRGRVLP
ncbi:MAG: hypothetical protein Q9202_007209 [Teloschistes flavicans]